jgi:hypothetical protein
MLSRDRRRRQGRRDCEGEWRDKLVDSGVYFDVAMTQFFGGNAYGGTQILVFG